MWGCQSILDSAVEQEKYFFSKQPITQLNDNCTCVIHHTELCYGLFGPEADSYQAMQWILLNKILNLLLTYCPQSLINCELELSFLLDLLELVMVQFESA